MNYRRNEDKQIASYQRKYNGVIEVKRTEKTATEPVSVADAKAHMRIDFPDEDSYIGKIITAARKAIEKITGRCLVPTEVIAILRNEKGGIELPFGPYVNETLVITDENDDEVENVEIEGIDFPTIKTPESRYLHCAYDAGYTAETLPTDLWLAICHQAAEMYEHRGDAKLSESARQLAKPYKRYSWLA
jgi:hypothetical protein